MKTKAHKTPEKTRTNGYKHLSKQLIKELTTAKSNPSQIDELYLLMLCMSQQVLFCRLANRG
jgi:hypothetical protein